MTPYNGILNIRSHNNVTSYMYINYERQIVTYMIRYVNNITIIQYYHIDYAFKGRLFLRLHTMCHQYI